MGQVKWHILKKRSAETNERGHSALWNGNTDSAAKEEAADYLPYVRRNGTGKPVDNPQAGGVVAFAEVGAKTESLLRLLITTHKTERKAQIDLHRNGCGAG